MMRRITLTVWFDTDDLGEFTGEVWKLYGEFMGKQGEQFRLENIDWE